MDTGRCAVVKTKKQAKELGLRTAEDWQRPSTALTPLRSETGIEVKGETFFREDQCEPLKSKTKWREAGLRVRADAKPVAAYPRRSDRYFVFRRSDCDRIKTPRQSPPKQIDLLAAIFRVNRSAKRFRDAALKSYEAEAYAFSTEWKQRKLDLYSLKERGIATALRQGRIKLMGRHGTLALYSGEGYSFHSPLLPLGVETEEPADGDNPIFVESKPVSAKDARLKDAVFTLEMLDPIDDSEWVKLTVPRQLSEAELPKQHAPVDSENEYWDQDEEEEFWERYYSRV